jgi:hypothetical protein
MNTCIRICNSNNKDKDKLLIQEQMAVKIQIPSLEFNEFDYNFIKIKINN